MRLVREDRSTVDQAGRRPVILDARDEWARPCHPTQFCAGVLAEGRCLTAQWGRTDEFEAAVGRRMPGPVSKDRDWCTYCDDFAAPAAGVVRLSGEQVTLQRLLGSEAHRCRGQ